MRRALLPALAGVALLGGCSNPEVSNAESEQMRKEFSQENYEKAMKAAGKEKELEAEKAAGAEREEQGGQ